MLKLFCYTKIWEVIDFSYLLRKYVIIRYAIQLGKKTITKIYLFNSFTCITKLIEIDLENYFREVFANCHCWIAKNHDFILLSKKDHFRGPFITCYNSASGLCIILPFIRFLNFNCILNIRRFNTIVSTPYY